MEHAPNIALVPVEGDVDVANVGHLRRTLDELIEGGCKRIVVNLDKAHYIDSAGMGLILREIRRMESTGGLISLTHASGRVMRALTLARVVDLVPVCGNAGTRVPALDPSALPLWRTTIKIDPDDLCTTRHRVGKLVARLPFTQDELFDLELAVGEALGNAVDHTCGECALVEVAAYRDRCVVEVTDCGCGIELAWDQDPDELIDRGEACPERGRGIKLMRLLADAVSIERKSSGTGTVVRIVKLVSGTKAHVRETPTPQFPQPADSLSTCL